jgi:hypothetical protein
LSDCQQEFGIPKRKHAVKNPNVIAAVIDRAAKAGHSSQSLNRIVEDILLLAGQEAVKKAA